MRVWVSVDLAGRAPGGQAPAVEVEVPREGVGAGIVFFFETFESSPNFTRCWEMTSKVV